MLFLRRNYIGPRDSSTKLQGTNQCYWRRQWQPTPVLLPGKFHGRRSLEGCSSWSLWGSGMTEQLHFHFSLSCIGERNGNPLQRSCLENPRDGGAWWAAICGVAESQTWLKRLSSNSSSNLNPNPNLLSRKHPMILAKITLSVLLPEHREKKICFCL